MSKRPILNEIGRDRYALKMPGYSRKFFMDTEELQALRDQIDEEINK